METVGLSSEEARRRHARWLVELSQRQMREARGLGPVRLPQKPWCWSSSSTFEGHAGILGILVQCLRCAIVL